MLAYWAKGVDSVQLITRGLPESAEGHEKVNSRRVPWSRTVYVDQ